MTQNYYLPTLVNACCVLHYFVKFMEMISTMYGLSQKQQLYQVAGSVSVPSEDRILIQCRLFNT